MFNVKRWIAWGLLISAGFASGQEAALNDSLILQGKAMIQSAVNTWNLEQMMAARAHFERLLGRFDEPWLVRYYVALVDFRIYLFHFSQENKDEARRYVDDGIAQLEAVIESKPDFEEGYALFSSLLGNKIALNPMLGMTLGMRSGGMMGKASSLAPENPRVALIAGESAYYTPKLFGGGRDKALEHIRKAIGLFETFRPERPVDPDWGYDEAYAYLGMIQMDEGQFDAAQASFEKGMEINPDNGWIRNDLMGQLAEKRGE